MAANTIKGLTVEIGGDTTKLGKALEDVNKKSRNLSSELGDINRLLRLDPGNTELLAQKQKVLADAVDNTKDKLDKLKQAEAQVQEQFKRGEVSEAQVRELQREIVATTNKLESYERAAKETADALEEVGDGAKKAAEESGEATTAMSNFASKGLKVVAGAAVAAVAALTAAAEGTRQYRTEMAKLDTAFTESGFSSEAATGAYKELVGVLGETEQAVETANHLAKLTDNEKDLATWTGDILPGVFATFGASLPIEGLTEAANETAKVGAVTGPLADALNWAGVSEEAFNESLAKCTTEQERQALITSTLVDLYGSASTKFKETNADVIAANQATDSWNASLAQVGATAEPFVAKVKELGAELLEKLVPILQWVLDNLPTIGVILAGLTAATIANKIATLAATAATQGMTLAQYAAATAQKVLNAAMKANPIGLIITIITALIAVIIQLVKNNDGLREKFVAAWNKIKEGVAAVVNWFKSIPEKIYNAIVGAVDRVKQVGKDLVSGLWNGVKDKLNWLKDKLKGFATSVLDGIKSFFGVHSPSTETAWVGEMLDRGLAEGVLDNQADPVKAMKTVTRGVLSAAQEADGLTLEQGLRQGSAVAGSTSLLSAEGLLGKLDNILAAIERGQVIAIDGDAFVGATVDRYDNKLGQRRILAARGAL